MKKTVLALLIVSLAVAACSSTGSADGKRSMTDTEAGALIGALGGAVVGAAVSKKKNRSKGALIGAVGGGLAGGAVGHYMDRQKQDLEKALKSERDAGAVTVEKYPNDVVKVTMTSQTAFDSGSVTLKPGFSPTMDKLANVVIQYGKTELTVVGHTDAEGSTQSNQELSQRRSEAVIGYLKAKNVNPARLYAEGRGELEPLADNKTEAGRRANRRVEIFVEPVRAE